MSAMRELRTAVSSDAGRRATNEDRVRVRCRGARCVALVADGAGGHRDGAGAAERAADAIEAALLDPGIGFEARALSVAVRAAHMAVRRGAADADPRSRPHSTVVVLWVDVEAGAALWSHVGDSRLYRVRDRLLEPMTTDDSVVQRLLEAGLVSAAQAEAHPQRNRLMAALGIDGDVAPHTAARPLPLRDGDRFLLCSDGWWGSVDAATIATALAASATPADGLDAMRRRVEARADPAQDNYSAVAVWVGEDDAAPTLPTWRHTATQSGSG